jgi:translation initiation factor eIF-2B subunit epsilon
VEEIFIYTGNHADDIENYLRQSKWMSKGSLFSSFQILRSQARSVGDAMRDLDKREILKNDFLVIYGDLISNLPLAPALAAHKKKRTEDKNCIMTMVLRQSHSVSSQNTGTPVFICDSRSNRCLHYESIKPHSEDTFLLLDSEVLQQPEVEIRADLIDCGIDICTPEFLALWSDNFDFQTPRDNFLYSVLKDYELNGKKIFTYIVDKHYIKRVASLQQYAAITKDVIGRWAYPLCPDTNLLHYQNYSLKRNHVYLDDNLQLARSCNIKKRSVIGAYSRIGKNAAIINSTIGPHCDIGDNVTIEDSFIWSHATVGSNTKVKQSMVAERARIGASCTIEPGALISFDVVIDDNITVNGTSKITRAKPSADPIDDLSMRDIKLVGKSGIGYLYTPDDDEDSEDNTLAYNSLTPAIYNLASLSLSQESVSVFSDDDSDSDSGSANGGPTPLAMRDRSAASSFVSADTEHDDDDDDDPSTAAAARRAAHDFHHEASSSLLEALQKSSPPSTVLLELNGLRLSTNASPHSMRRAVAHAFVKHIVALVGSGTALKDAVEGTVGPHVEMWRRIVFDREAEEKDDQADLLLCVQNELKAKNSGDAILSLMLHQLVHLDVVEAEGVEQWWNGEKSGATEEMRAVRASSKQLVDFLLEDDDDEDEDEESEEE